MNTKFFETKFWNTPRGPGHPGKILGTSQAPPFETQGRQTFQGGHELFDHHPIPWKKPHPTRRSPDPKVNLCALSCLIKGHFRDMSVWRWLEPCFEGIWARDPPGVV